MQVWGQQEDVRIQTPLGQLSLRERMVGWGFTLCCVSLGALFVCDSSAGLWSRTTPHPFPPSAPICLEEQPAPRDLSLPK